MLGTDTVCPSCGRALRAGAVVEPAPLTLALVSLGAVVGSALLVQLVISVLNQRAGV